MNLSIVSSDSSVPNDQIWVSILGYQPTTPWSAAPPSANFGYIDLTSSTPSLVETGTSGFSYKSGVTSQTLAQLISTFGSSIPIPAIQSARIYFAIGSDFSAADMPASGPAPGWGTTIMYDTVEFDTSNPGTYNINPTNVDFYGISYTVSVGSVTTGFTNTRSDVISQLLGITLSPVNQESGNTNIFTYCAINSSSNVLRVLSPKTMALTDWDPSSQANQVTYATQASHFFDDYVLNEVWKPGRQFTFYNKLYSAGAPNPAQYQLWGEVTSDGSLMNLYTDAQRTQRYTNVPTLAPPATSWPNPSFNTPSNYHNTSGSSAADVDWGFLLIGNVATNCGFTGSKWGDVATIAIMVSICRGVAHLDDGTTSWVTSSNYYQGSGSGTSTESMPVLFYSSLLHQLGVNGLAYALSLDDVYGQNSSIQIPNGGTVTVTLESLANVAPPSS
jgi:hypothetical protein